MGSEYATGEGSSFTRGGRMPDTNNNLGAVKVGPSNAGLAKAMVDGVRAWVSQTAELMGFWRGDRTRHRF